MILLRQQILPFNFKKDLGKNNDEDLGLIYKVFLPKYRDVNTLLEKMKRK